MNPADRLDCAQLEEARGAIEPERGKNRIVRDAHSRHKKVMKSLE